MFIVPINRMLPIQTNKIETNKNDNSDNTTNSGINNSFFSDIFKTAVQNAVETQKVVDEDAIKLAQGEIDNLSDMMINNEKAAMALEFTVQLTNKAMNAYNEIMRMQI